MNTCPTLLIHILAGACLAIATPAVRADTTELLAVGGEIYTGSGRSVQASVSADGRYVAFESDANNLVIDDTNRRTDIFVHDRNTGTTRRVSVDSAGIQSNGDSHEPAISADGSYVAFGSFASNLVSGDTNFVSDIFVHDLDTRITTRVSVDSLGGQGNSYSHDSDISADGQYVAFRSNSSNLVSGDTYGHNDIFVHDTTTGITTRVSVATDGAQCLGDSYDPAISGDGNYVAFRTRAGNLVSGDSNSDNDVFVHELDTGTTTRVSVDSFGGQGNGGSLRPAISGDGQYVAFASGSSNLVSGDTNEATDVFVHDRFTRTTTRVSVDSAGTQGIGFSDDPAISADGRYVVFESYASNLVSGDTNETYDIFVHDREGTTTRVSVDSAGVQGNSESKRPAISGDGRYVAFDSPAGNLVNDDANGVYDIFVHELNTGNTDVQSLAEMPWFGANGLHDSGRLSADGNYVAFDSSASNLISGDTNEAYDVFVYERDTRTTTRISVDSAGVQGNSESKRPAITADGRYVAFDSTADNLVNGDTNGAYDVFVHDRITGTTTRVSVDSAGGVQGNSHSLRPAISDNGRYVAFDSGASNLVSGDTNDAIDIFVHDRETRTTTRVSVDGDGGMQGNGDSYYPAISADGRYVAFESEASNLVSGDTNEAYDVFVHDTINRTTTRISVDSAGVQGNDSSRSADITSDGRYVAFDSGASNLVNGDTNWAYDVFVHDRDTRTTTLVSVDSAGVHGNAYSFNPSISADGRYVAFESEASNLVSDDSIVYEDIFVHDRDTGTTVKVSVDSAGVPANRESSSPAISADGTSIVFSSWADNLDPTQVIFLLPQTYVFTFTDTDSDWHFDAFDNCVDIPNGGQRDTDRDGFGNICDADFNDDCIINFLDLTTMRRQFFTNDTQPNWDPDVDLNNDGIVNFIDLMVVRILFFRAPGPSNMPNICEAGCGLRSRAFAPTEHFGVELYVRGSFNDWGSAPPYNLINYGDGVYRTQVEVGAAEHQLKIADENWTLEYDAPTRLLLNEPLLLDSGSPGSANIFLNLESNGCYNFRIEPVDSGTPPAQVELIVNRKP